MSKRFRIAVLAVLTISQNAWAFDWPWGTHCFTYYELHAKMEKGLACRNWGVSYNQRAKKDLDVWACANADGTTTFYSFEMKDGKYCELSYLREEE